MTLRLDASRLVLSDDDSGRELASSLAATTNQVIVRGADGAHDDTLTVDVTAISLARGIDYDGGVGGWDTLVLHGDSAGEAHRITQLSPHDGIIDLEALQIRYAGLEPFTDTIGSVTLLFTATGGGEEINIIDGPPGPPVTTQINSGASGTFELLNFANKTNVFIDGNGGADIYTLNNPNPAAGLAALTLQGSASAELFRVTPSTTIPYTVTGGDPVPPGTGDTLIVSLAGTTGLVYSLSSDASGLQGSFTFSNRATVNFSQVETINPSDVGITKTGPPTLFAGNNATYTITITNNGTNDAANVALTDVVPANMTFISVSTPAGATCSSTPPAGGTGTLSCMTPVLLAGASQVYTLVLRLDPATADGTLVTNSASVSTGTSETGPGDNSASSSVIAGTQADLSVNKTGPATIPVFSNATYTIVATNNGPSNAAGPITFADILPAGATFVSLAAPAGFSCTTPAPGSAGPITCTTPAMTVTSVTFTLVATLGSTGTVTNFAQLFGSPTFDPNGMNNSSGATTVVSAAQADLAIIKTGPGSVLAGSNVTFTLTVSNAGPATATAVTVNDILPTGMTFVSATPSQGTCAPPSAPATTVICNAGTLANAASMTITIVATTPSTGPSILNTANVTAAETDPNLANNAASLLVTLTAPTADLAITKTGPASVAPGGNITYTIGVTNNGPNNATAVTITDILLAGATFVSATPSQGTCTGTTTVTCNAGTLASAASMTVTLVVTAPSIGVSASNTASVSAAELDPVLANNSATAIVTLTAPGAIPTMSEWALLLLAASLGLLAVLKLK